MKIGILTFHDTTNFGSLLQTYGLYKAIEKLGRECEVIDYQCQSIVERELPRPIKFTFNVRLLARQLLLHYFATKKYRALSKFSVKRLKLSRRYDRSDISKSDNNYDKYVVGSDIVWGLDITKGDTAYFLDFVSDKSRKFAFSSSIGNPWEEKDKTVIRPLVSEFSYIAVREEESAQWIEELTSQKPDVVCDPTMLISSDEWAEIKSDKYKEQKYVLVYFDNSQHSCLNMAKQYAKQHNLKVLFINYGIPVKGVCSVHPYSLEDFLSLIYYADRVFTASYHGMLFSVYFNKQFVYFNRAHKSRMNTLAKRLNVQNCNGEEVDVMKMPMVDYDTVNNLVEQYRNHSIEKLKYILDV